MNEKRKKNMNLSNEKKYCKELNQKQKKKTKMFEMSTNKNKFNFFFSSR